MKKNICYHLICVVTLAFLLSGCANPAAQPTPTQTQEPSSTSIPPSNTPEPTGTTAPTLTPEPTATITRTPLPTATNTPDRTATKQAESTQAAEVVIGEIMEELAAVGLSSENGYLLWAQEEPLELYLGGYNEWTYEDLAEGKEGSNFILKTEITWESTSGLMVCGLFFRSEKNIEEGKQYLYAMIRLSGLPAWAITFRQYGEYRGDVSNMRTNSAIDQGQMSTNKVVLIAEDEKFTRYINDSRVGSFYDYSERMMEGYFAYFMSQESGESSCEFSNTWVWALE